MPFNSIISWLLEYFKEPPHQTNIFENKFKKPDAYKNINSFSIKQKS